MSNTINERTEIYDEMCRVLTDYELGDAAPDELYKMLVIIQRRWEDCITAEDDTLI